MIEASSTHIHNLEQATAAFRDFAEIMGIMRAKLIESGFTETGAESMVEVVAQEMLCHDD